MASNMGSHKLVNEYVERQAQLDTPAGEVAKNLIKMKKQKQ